MRSEMASDKSVTSNSKDYQEAGDKGPGLKTPFTKEDFDKK